jgi:hypothetical protein
MHALNALAEDHRSGFSQCMRWRYAVVGFGCLIVVTRRRLYYVGFRFFVGFSFLCRFSLVSFFVALLILCSMTLSLFDKAFFVAQHRHVQGRDLVCQFLVLFEIYCRIAKSKSAVSFPSQPVGR